MAWQMPVLCLRASEALAVITVASQSKEWGISSRTNSKAIRAFSISLIPSENNSEAFTLMLLVLKSTYLLDARNLSMAI